MICHNCGNEVSSGKTCPHCGADLVLMEKARNASLRQYNKGVSLAKEGDYSGAIACLNRCVLIDKRNYVARNLLGYKRLNKKQGKSGGKIYFIFAEKCKAFGKI